MLIPAFVQREVAPLGHTHSQGDVTGAGAGASAAKRGLFLSIAPENVTSIRAYFEVRDGLSAKRDEIWLIEAWMDSVTPPVQPRAVLISTAVVAVGEFFACAVTGVGADGDHSERSRDMFFHTTSNGSAVVIYGEAPHALTAYLAAETVSPMKSAGAVVFT